GFQTGLWRLWVRGRKSPRLLPMAALALKADKAQRCWHVSFVPVLLQKSAIIAARLPASSSRNGSHHPLFVERGRGGTDTGHRVGKTWIGWWWRSSDQLRKPA